MAYTTVAAIREEAPFKDELLIPDALVTEKIAQADGIINSRIGDVYTLPLSVGGVALVTFPDDIVFISGEIAKALLYLSQFSEEIAGSTVDGNAMLEAANAFLDDIQSQKRKLRDSEGTELDRSSLLQPVGYPTEASTEDGTTPIAFSMDQQF